MLKLYYVDMRWRGLAMCFAHDKVEALEKLRSHLADHDDYCKQIGPMSFVSGSDEELMKLISEQEPSADFIYRNWGDS